MAATILVLWPLQLLALLYCSSLLLTYGWYNNITVDRLIIITVISFRLSGNHQLRKLKGGQKEEDEVSLYATGLLV